MWSCNCPACTSQTEIKLKALAILILASMQLMDQKLEEEEDIVIVGGGICGLATALALHRKGIKSIVLERSESLRATGTAIGIHTNGWRALDQLGVGSNLRPKANVITRLRDISLSNGSQKKTQIETGEEFRCVKRIDLIEVLANSLSPDTVRFGYHIVAVKLDPLTSHPLIQLQDGSFIKSKVVIGCDGVNSVTSELLGLKPARFFSICGVRGFTNYPSGHGFSNTFIRMRKDCLLLGRLPVNDNLVHWFVGHEPCTPSDSRVLKDPELIRQASIEWIKDFPTEMIEMIKNTDLDSLTCTQLRYRTPWELLLGSFLKGTMTVAGDAMHVMGPFLGQGGSAALEDAVVLARNLASEVCTGESDVTGKQKMQERVGAAIDNYLKERRLRLFKLSTQAYLIGMLSQATSPLTKLMHVIALVLFFRNSLAHTRYDCGRL